MTEQSSEDMGKTSVKVSSRKVKPGWIKANASEAEKNIVELGKDGVSPARIGLILRDKHGIPRTQLIGERIKKILEKNNINYVSEKNIEEAHIEKIKRHIARHKHDHGAKRALTKRLWTLYNLNKIPGAYQVMSEK